MPPSDLVAIEENRCTRCGACARVCPPSLFLPRRGKPPELSPDARQQCLRCGHCAAICPADAVRHGDLDPADFPPAPETLDFQTVLGLLRSRRSVRVYEPREVPEEAVHQLLQAARYAPTGHHSCHVGATVLLDPSAVAALREAVVRFFRRFAAVIENPAGRLVARLVVGGGRVEEVVAALPGFRLAAERLERGDDPLFHGAPAVLLFHAPPGETSEVDCALAAGQVTLLAPSLGLGTCHIGYASAVLKRSTPSARAAGVPGGERVYAVLAAGYPAVSYPRLAPRPPLSIHRL